MKCKPEALNVVAKNISCFTSHRDSICNGLQKVCPVYSILLQIAF